MMYNPTPRPLLPHHLRRLDQHTPYIDFSERQLGGWSGGVKDGGEGVREDGDDEGGEGGVVWVG